MNHYIDFTHKTANYFEISNNDSLPNELKYGDLVDKHNNQLYVYDGKELILVFNKPEIHRFLPFQFEITDKNDFCPD